MHVWVCVHTALPSRRVFVRTCVYSLPSLSVSVKPLTQSQYSGLARLPEILSWDSSKVGGFPYKHASYIRDNIY